MKKSMYVFITVLAIMAITLGVSNHDRNNQIHELMLKNIECLATPENPTVRCYFSGTVDCPKDVKPVLYYW
jgi:hypothetical protein